MSMARAGMNPLELVRLPELMARSEGSREIAVALIDGPVALDHPALARATIRLLPGRLQGACGLANSAACTHGTLVAGMLVAERGSGAPGICPGCTLLVRPIFAEGVKGNGEMPSASPEELAQAVTESVKAGARVLNVSAALVQASPQGESSLEQALNYAGQRGAMVVAAAGNQATVGSSVITRHPWVIPVAASDLQGRPMSESNLGSSIGRHGVSAPGESVTSLGTNGKVQSFGGTSAAAPFVSGAIALLWSLFPAASAARLRRAILGAGGQPRRSIVPRLLDAEAAYRAMAG